MVDFAKMAEVSLEDLPPVKLMPVGTYRWVTDKVPERKSSANGKSLLINFRMKCLGPIDDFEDPDALEVYGSVMGQVRTLMFVYPEVAGTANDPDESAEAFTRRQTEAYRRLSAFLTNDLKVEGKNAIEQMPLSANHQCLIQLTHELDNRDNETMRERLGKTAPLPE